MKNTPVPQWKDSGTYKEPVDTDNVRMPRLEIDGAATYIDKDGSGNMTLTDAVTGTKTLAELVGHTQGTDTTLGTMTAAVNMGGYGISALLKVDFSDFAEITLDTDGACTVTQTCHTIDTFEDAASDDLVTINGGTNGAVIYVKPANGARTVVVKHNTGNVWLQGAADVTLDDAQDMLCLVYDGTKWCDVAAGGGGSVATDAIWDAAGDIAKGTGANTADVVNIAEQRVVGRLTGEAIKGLTAAEVLTLILAVARAVDTSLADHAWDGRTVAGVAGETLTRGQAIYLKAADSKWWKAQGNAYATARGIIGLATDASKNADEAITVLLPGSDTLFRDDSLTLTVNGEYFLDPDTAGAFTIAASISWETGDQIRRWGYGLTSHIFIFDADGTVLEYVA
jgi:hypothetical protein